MVLTVVASQCHRAACSCSLLIAPAHTQPAPAALTHFTKRTSPVACQPTFYQKAFECKCTSNPPKHMLTNHVLRLQQTRSSPPCRCCASHSLAAAPITKSTAPVPSIPTFTTLPLNLLCTWLVCKLSQRQETMCKRVTLGRRVGGGIGGVVAVGWWWRVAVKEHANQGKAGV